MDIIVKEYDDIKEKRSAARVPNISDRLTGRGELSSREDLISDRIGRTSLFDSYTRFDSPSHAGVIDARTLSTGEISASQLSDNLSVVMNNNDPFNSLYVSQSFARNPAIEIIYTVPNTDLPPNIVSILNDVRSNPGTKMLYTNNSTRNCLVIIIAGEWFTPTRYDPRLRGIEGWRIYVGGTQE